MSSKTDEILESLKTLSLLEASELVKQIEEAFGVSAAASAGVAIPAKIGPSTTIIKPNKGTKDTSTSFKISALGGISSAGGLGAIEGLSHALKTA